MCDSTHPDAVRGFRSWATAARTVLCVSSKSGTTTETNAFHASLAESVPALDFIAITDPGTPLGELARTQEFRSIVEGEPTVGGRYQRCRSSASSRRRIRGVDIEALLAGARRHGRRLPPAGDGQPGARRWARRSAKRRSPGGTSSPS